MPSQEILLGDCLEVLKEYPDNTFNVVVTDPPYGLSFLNAEWDYEVPGPEYWREVYRVCKPGTPLLATGIDSDPSSCEIAIARVAHWRKETGE
jgi:predicted methyltransferase